MNRLELSVSRFRRSLWWMLWLRLAVRSLVVGFWTVGCVILSLRLLWNLPVSDVAWALLPLALLLFGAGWLASWRIPPAWAVRAMIDRASEAQGLVMADGEIELGAWKSRVHEGALQNPRIRWTYSKSVGGVVVAALFVFLTLVIPEGWLTHQPLFAKSMDVKTDIKKLNEKIELLEEMGVLPKEDAETARSELQKIEKDAQGNDPSKTLEAMAHQEDQLKKLAEDVAADAAERAQEASALAAAAQTLNEAASKMSKESLQEAMEKMADLAKKAEADAQSEGSDSMEKAGDICKDGLSADELQELSEALGGCSKEMQDMLDQLGDMGMLEGEFGQGGRPLTPEELQMLLEGFLEECEGCEGMDGEALEALLLACRGCLGGEPCDCFLGCFPGRGGVTRGPGAAKIQFSGETDEHGATFENKVLMPGGLNKEGKTVVKKTSLGQPGKDEEKELSSGGGLGAAGGTGGAHTRTVLPTHRRVVREYFERDGEKK